MFTGSIFHIYDFSKWFNFYNSIVLIEPIITYFSLLSLMNNNLNEQDTMFFLELITRITIANRDR